MGLEWVGISCVVSIISLFVSIKTFYKNKKIAEKNLNKKFFEDIYSEYMTDKIPQVLLKIQSDRLKFNKSCDELERLVNEILDKGVFYKFFEPNFYDDTKNVLIELDDRIVSLPDKEISAELMLKYSEEINKLVKKLYDVLKKYYSKI